MSLNPITAPAPPGSLPAPPARPDSRITCYLPPSGFERVAFLILAALILALKILAIYHFRSDSDETQHAHVVWGWVTGKLQYRDFFDNHMPLFQMACAPFMALIGQRADIMIWLRWLMLPMYFINLWAVFRITEILYSRRIAPWSALLAGILAKFFYTSTEFRTDQLWTVFWLLSLMVAIGGRFTLRRAFGFGLMLGFAGAVSVKTVALVVAIGSSAVIAMAFASFWRARPALLPAATRLLAIAAGMIIPPAATVLYFVWKGAFWIMYYCVIAHNIVPGLKRWGQFSLHQWYYPLSIPLLAAYAWLIFHQTPDKRLAIRRALILLTPWFFLFLLFSYWPDITREDDLPYVPLVPVSLIPLLILATSRLRDERWRRNLLTYGLPATVLCALLITFQTHNIREDRLRVTTHNIADVLLLTKPNDCVMENKGDYVFRPRAFYWVLEPITKARIRMGLIRDDIPRHLIATGTKICFFRCGRNGSLLTQFILANYLPFDPQTRDMGILGKIIGNAPAAATFPFQVTIPQRYAVVTESGHLAGALDGKPYTGPLWLQAGPHQFQRTSGAGRAAIFLNDAILKGFSPLYDDYEDLAKEIAVLSKNKHGAPEEQ